MKKTFSGKKSLKIIPFFCLLFFFGVVGLSVAFKIRYRVFDFFPMLMIIVLLFVLSKVYFSHEKNAMKAALSAILAILGSWQFYYLTDSISYIFLSEDVVPEFFDWFFLIVYFISSVLFTMIMTYHFLLTAEHKSNFSRIRKNTTAFMLIVILFIVSLGYDIVKVSNSIPGKRWWAVECTTILMKLFEFAALFEVIEIEILLNMFRRKREQQL